MFPHGGMAWSPAATKLPEPWRPAQEISDVLSRVEWLPFDLKEDDEANF